MPTYEEDTKLGAGEVAGTLIGDTASGAMGGLAAGSIFPGLGNLAGALIGGTVGLGTGIADLFSQKKALEDAAAQQSLLDEELAKSNANLELYLSGVSEGTGKEIGIERNRAKEAGARAGLSDEQTYLLEQQGVDSAAARGAEQSAQALMQAVQMDQMRRAGILNEFQVAQQLANNATDNTGGYGQALGGISAGLMEFAGAKAGQDAGKTEAAKTGQSAQPGQSLVPDSTDLYQNIYGPGDVQKTGVPVSPMVEGPSMFPTLPFQSSQNPLAGPSPVAPGQGGAEQGVGLPAGPVAAPTAAPTPGAVPEEGAQTAPFQQPPNPLASGAQTGEIRPRIAPKTTRLSDQELTNRAMAGQPPPTSAVINAGVQDQGAGVQDYSANIKPPGSPVSQTVMSEMAGIQADPDPTSRDAKANQMLDELEQRFATQEVEGLVAEGGAELYKVDGQPVILPDGKSLVIVDDEATLKQLQGNIIMTQFYSFMSPTAAMSERRIKTPAETASTETAPTSPPTPAYARRTQR